MSALPPETISEHDAALMIGWSPAALRSHRLRWEAQQTADALEPQDRKVLKPWAPKETRRLTRAQAERLEGLVVRSGRAWGLTRQGADVARRLRNGERQTPCANPPPFLRLGNPPRIRYEREAVQQWIDDHPEVRDEARLRAETIDLRAVAKIMSETMGRTTTVGTLKSARSKADRAALRIEQGQARKGDEDLAASLPRWIWVGSEKRYREADVRRWCAIHAPPPQDPDPLVVERDPARGDLLTSPELAELAGLSPKVIAGYRARARRAILEQQRELREQLDALVKARDAGEFDVPPHVVAGSRVLYQRADVEVWLARRNGE